MDLSKFSPVGRRMIEKLMEGQATPEQLHGCLSDELGAKTNIQPHLTHIRRILESRGEDVVYRNGVYYLVRRITSN